MNVEPIDLGLAPIVFRHPVAGELLDRRQLHALRIIRNGFRFWPGGRRQAAEKVRKPVFGYVDAEGADRIVVGCRAQICGKQADGGRRRCGGKQTPTIGRQRTCRHGTFSSCCRKSLVLRDAPSAPPPCRAESYFADKRGGSRPLAAVTPRAYQCSSLAARGFSVEAEDRDEKPNRSARTSKVERPRLLVFRLFSLVSNVLERARRAERFPLASGVEIPQVSIQSDTRLTNVRRDSSQNAMSAGGTRESHQTVRNSGAGHERGRARVAASRSRRGRYDQDRHGVARHRAGRRQRQIRA